jgi:hypothetical protein
VRLEPGQRFENTYTFKTELGVTIADTIRMKESGELFVGLGNRWTYADEIGDGSGHTEMGELLRQRGAVRWKADCKVDFTAVA